MLQLSMNELTTMRWSFEKDVHEYAAAGFDGIGIWREKLSDVGEETAVELLHAANLRCSNLLWAGGLQEVTAAPSETAYRTPWRPFARPHASVPIA